MLLWVWDAQAGRWAVQEISGEEPTPLGADAMLVPLRGARCALLASGAARVNGLPALPVRILADKDEIQTSGRTYYFSAETLLSVVRFESGGKEIHCARCDGTMRDGDAAALCPRCKAAYHEACWPYAAKCASCGRSTAGLSWMPEPYAFHEVFPS